MKANIPISFLKEKRYWKRLLKECPEIWKKAQNEEKDSAIEEFEVRKQYENGF